MKIDETIKKLESAYGCLVGSRTDNNTAQQQFKEIIAELKQEQQKVSEESNQEKVIELINTYWKFDKDQDPVSTWHDKQDLISAIEQLNIIITKQKSSTTVLLNKLLKQIKKEMNFKDETDALFYLMNNADYDPFIDKTKTE